jgi:hypothetical protein
VDYTEADEDERYNDSEYVDDEVASLLNNAFLQIGTIPNGRLDEEHAHPLERNGPPGYEDDQESIEVVIGDQKDKILRRTLDRHMSDDDEEDLAGHTVPVDGADLSSSSRNSWSTASTRSQKPFAPVNKKKKSASGANKNNGISNSDGGSSSSNTNGHPHHGHRTPKVCPHSHPSSQEQQPLLNQHSRGASAREVHAGMTYGATGRPYPSSQPHPHSHSHPPPANAPRSDHATHLRRTSFPRLKTQNSIYSTHDNLDHAVADDREHADLTEIGLQTALTIAVHKFPGNPDRHKLSLSLSVSLSCSMIPTGGST